MSEDKLVRKPATIETPEEQEELELLDNITVDDRRLKVWSMKLQGTSLKDISSSLGISVTTVKRDLEAIKVQNKAYVENVDKDAVVSTSISQYDNIINKAWEEFNRPGLQPATRLKCLELIRITQNDRMKVMQEVGLIEIVSDRVDHQIKFDVISDWDEEIRALAARAILESKFKELLPPEPAEVIEIPPVEEVKEK